MKRIFSILAIALTILVSLAFGQPAFAEVSAGAKIFNNNCAQCHAGGKNNVVAAKTLKADALEKYGKNTVEAISLQVSKGKGAMPAFGKKLSADEITLVANYVLDQAEKGWPKS
ncbi:cytochrome C6 [Pseudanabaena sp. SR411]|jgi:cytochrome c6|uniref:cytochrome c6 PetJ n=1 Tax=Pseudanabaena sp. SR411 TaxID=1980935 RepID=UPI000B98F393|nr:c-type cytochrome [Pseudanabaena sp. SR411]OYQ64296.1 cytochrome C6 [Pseudanabaena sp. SR411]